MKEYTVKISDGNIAVDDTILVASAKCGAGSRILEGFEPLFSAEAVTRLEKAGKKIAGKTAVGEFGLDLVGEFSYGNEQEGALRGAAAELVRKGEVEAALAVDMNGAPRRAAALSDVSFLKPTYGTVSRYGVVSCAASGEQIGVYGKKVNNIAPVMEIIAGHDEKDGTSLPEEKYTYDCGKSVSGMKVAIVKELLEKADEETQKKVKAYAASLEKAGVKVEEISSDLFLLAAPAWQILMCAETCNNVSRYDGVKYGHRAKEYRNIDELYVKSRTEGFNFLTKAVILYGSEVLSKARYKESFEKALKVRRVVADGMKEILSQFDAILTPVLSTEKQESYPISEAFEKSFREGFFTAVPSLIGLPALVSGGVQLMGKHFGESEILSLACSVEE